MKPYHSLQVESNGYTMLLAKHKNLNNQQKVETIFFLDLVMRINLRSRILLQDMTSVKYRKDGGTLTKNASTVLFFLSGSDTVHFSETVNIGF